MKIIASVVIPTYNDSKLEDCLKSLRLQVFPRKQYEVIVVDNNSNKINVAEIVKKYNFNYIHEPRKGAYFARNNGLFHTKGEYVLFTDSDCKFDKNWIKEMIRPFENRKVGIVGGVIRKTQPTNIIERNTECLAEGQIKPRQKTFFKLPYIIAASMCFRRSLLLRLAGFDESFTFGGDVDMSWRVQLEGFQLVIAQKAILYHDSRASYNDYFTQYFRYGIGHAHLLKKYSNAMLKIHIDINNLFVLLKSILLYIFYSFIRFFDNNELYEKYYLQVIRSLGLIKGRIKGSFKHHVIYF